MTAIGKQGRFPHRGRQAAAAVIVGTATLDGDRLHLVCTRASVGIGILVAFTAKIKIWTGITVPAISREDLLATRTARLYEFGSPTIMKMPKNHHRGVFGSPELVELIVVASTKVQEGLAIVQELAHYRPAVPSRACALQGGDR